MSARLFAFILLLPLASGVCGCAPSGCAPSELFSCIDRNCYVADWTNHHSCVSCCCCKHGSCCRPPQPSLPMLELGEHSAVDAASK